MIEILILFAIVYCLYLILRSIYRSLIKFSDATDVVTGKIINWIKDNYKKLFIVIMTTILTI